MFGTIISKLHALTNYFIPQNSCVSRVPLIISNIRFVDPVQDGNIGG